MERITEKDLAALEESLTAAFRAAGRIDDSARVGLWQPWSMRAWGIISLESGAILSALEGATDGTRRSLYGAGRAMLWAVRGY